ncbi:phosphoheptose isomerase [Candidatus Endobugula sertula]|uniref:Phosphoheptose isomerase n=1 Tax=Candidatus Endobugula sertula TaxID=62101 RepID=A0A1D2QSG9_9GAMM|nr:phosphoheptose isomerase [Candidatus Endobugula sertula]
MLQSYSVQLDEHLEVMSLSRHLAPTVETAGRRWVSALHQGGKILLMGNGGSAADAQHIAAELVGRYLCERKGLSAIALTTDTSILTAVGNDYGYDKVFSRQIEALAQPQDVVVAYSTSGNSTNVCEAMKVARNLGCYTLGLTGVSGGKLMELVDDCICVPSSSTPRIQEVHAFIGHMLCAIVDASFENS